VIRLDHREKVPGELRGAILALGNFDGFHLGHQAVVREAVEWAKGEGRPVIVGTFDPHPVRFFKPDVPPFRLTTLDQRQELFADAGADGMLVFHFDGTLAGMSADAFTRDILLETVGAAGVVTGEDFSFGKARSGNPAVLAQLGSELGFGVRTVGPVAEAGGIVSSSRIREALQAGDCETAAELMTRPYAIRGDVQHGDKLGRTIGFPTANLAMGNYLRPRYGIYAITGRIIETGEILKGAANLGIRPSFDPPKELLEPYFFDFSGNLYGREIEVALRRFIRPEAKFDSLEALQEQMARDCDEARAILA
jgi:riboflavin kinase/FMN adenylyltransferase